MKANIEGLLVRDVPVKKLWFTWITGDSQDKAKELFPEMQVGKSGGILDLSEHYERLAIYAGGFRIIRFDDQYPEEIEHES